MARWIKSKHPGIRYRGHDTRLHGVGNKPDRYCTIFYDKFTPHIQAIRRARQSWKRDESHFRLWIGPVIGSNPQKEVAPFDLERILKNMTKAGRAARSIVYALDIIRLAFNFAQANDLYAGKNPAGPADKVKRPITDNKRLRYLSQ